MKRTAALVAVAALGLFMGPGAALAAPKQVTLGGRLAVQGGSLVLEDVPRPPVILVQSKASAPVRATLDVAGTGYSLLRTDLGILTPGQTVSDPLVAVGSGPATLTAHLVPAFRVVTSGPGEGVGLELSLSVRHRSPLEAALAVVGGPVPPLGLLVGSTGLLGVLWAVRRSRRPSRPVGYDAVRAEWMRRHRVRR